MPNSEIAGEDPEQLILSLLRKLKDGIDRDESFRQLFAIYYARVRRSFPHRVPPEERQDLIQEVFLRVYRGLRGWPEDVEGFEHWLFAVARNVYRNWLQSRQRLKRQGWEVSLSGTLKEDGESELADAQKPPQDTVLEHLLQGERARLLHRAIEDMPEQMRACVLLRVGQDLKYREISTALGLAEGTVKAHLNRAKMWLRNALGPYFEDFDL